MDGSFFFLIITLQTIGLIMLFSASYVTAFQEKNQSTFYVVRQTCYAVGGILIMLGVAQFVDYHWLRKLVWVAYAGALGLMGIALCFKGKADANRWIRIGPITFQPSELMKFAIILVCAHLIACNYKRITQFPYGFLNFVILLAPVLGLLFFQRHLSAMILILLITATMMLAGGSRFRWFIGAALLGGVLVLALYLFSPYVRDKFSYVMERLLSFMHPLEGDLKGSKWQIAQGLYAIGSGGLMGVGLGNSTQKHLYVSEPQNDMIFSIVCEELGFVGAIVIILLFILLICSGLSIAMRAPDRFGCMLAIGLTAQVAWQALLNIAVVTNSMPNTGIPLPFFSSGGTALIMLLAEMGIVLNISRQASRPNSRKKDAESSAPSIASQSEHSDRKA